MLLQADPCSSERVCLNIKQFCMLECKIQFCMTCVVNVCFLCQDPKRIGVGGKASPSPNTQEVDGARQSWCTALSKD